MKFNFRLRGVPELKNAFDKLQGSSQRKVLRQGLKKSGELALDVARQNAPIDTGELVSEMNVKVTVGKTKAVAKVTAGNARHGSLIELGMPGRGIPAQPFMRPAIYDNHDSIRAVFLNEIKEAVLEAGFKEAQIQQKSIQKKIRKANKLFKKIQKKVTWK